MKPKSFLLGFILLSLIAFSMLSFVLMARGATYSLGVSVGDEMKYKISKNDNGEVVGAVGDIITFSIVDIKETAPGKIDNGWLIKYHPGSVDVTLEMPILYQYPMEYPKNGILLFICPKSVGVYLIDMARNWYPIKTSAANADRYLWTLNAEGLTNYPTSNSWSITYDDKTGWAVSYQAYLNGALVTELNQAQTSSVPGYNLPILLGVTAIFTMGLAIIKKMWK